MPGPRLGATPKRLSLSVKSLSLMGRPAITGPVPDAKPGHALGFAGPEASSPGRVCRQPLARKIKRKHTAEVIQPAAPALLRLCSTRLFMDPAFLNTVLIANRGSPVVWGIPLKRGNRTSGA